MADFKPTPRNSVLGAISDYLQGARRLGDKVELPWLGGAGSLLLGESPEAFDALAYGDYPMEIPAQGNLPQFKPGRDMQTLDAVGALPFLRATGRAAASLPAAVRHGAEEFAQASFAGSPAIVKPKGGNWLGGLEAIRENLETLLPYRYPKRNRGAIEALPPENVHAKQGFKYLDKETGELYTPEYMDPILAHGDWINNTLARYQMRDMGTLGDPVRALAEQGVTHINDPGAQNLQLMDLARIIRKDTGNAVEGVAQSPEAKIWEDISDAAIQPSKIGEYIGRSNIDPRVRDENPWMYKLNPEDLVYEINTRPHNLGFDHLSDELWNALRPDSDLPPELRLRPESMTRVSVPQAVQRVSDINKYRAQQMEKAALGEMNSPALRVHKEYPEGYKWVKIGPEDGFEKNPGDAYYGLGRDRYLDIQKALKFEGDSMGHCVGGYCDDVIEGRSNIYSLRDAKGNPHVTIETAPGLPQSFSLARDRDRLTPEELARFDATEDPRKWMYPLEIKLLDEARISEIENRPGRIVQIKGKQNKAPIADYLPFVQDFVKSQPWADVGDLKNAGLFNISDISLSPVFKDLPGEAIYKISKAENKYGRYVTEQEVLDLVKKTGYAQGGHVDLRALADQAYREIQR